MRHLFIQLILVIVKKCLTPLKLQLFQPFTVFHFCFLVKQIPNITNIHRNFTGCSTMLTQPEFNGSVD